MSGYIKDHRKELDSDIWLMPPLYHRVWQYLKYKANYEPAEIPLRDGSKLKIFPGQHLTSMRDIAKNISWYERGKLETPNPKTIDAILKWLETQNMIEIQTVTGNTSGTVTGNRYGTLITLVNWGIYQFIENESNRNKQGVTCYHVPKEELKNTTTTIVDTHAQENGLIEPIPEIVPENKPSEQSPFIQLIDAYCELHGKLEYHVIAKERTLMNRMIAGGMPVPFIIRTMNLAYEAKRMREEEDGGTFFPPNSFLYYQNIIFEAWENESITESVAQGVPFPRTEKVALGSSSRSRKQQQFDELDKFIEEERQRANC